MHEIPSIQPVPHIALSLQMYISSMRRNICRYHACGLSLWSWVMLKENIFCHLQAMVNNLNLFSCYLQKPRCTTLILNKSGTSFVVSHSFKKARMNGLTILT